MGCLKEKLTDLSRSLAFKIGLWVGGILLGSYVIFIYLVLDIQQKLFFDRLVREADRFSSSVIKATRYSMLHDDPEATQNIVSNMSTEAQIYAIRIYNHEGITKFSSHAEDVGTRVDKQAEACFACHSKDEPFSHVVTDQRTRVHSHEGYRVLGIITPIYNEPSCYTAVCHVHPANQKVLGVLDIGMSMKGYDAHVRSLVTKIVLLGLGTCAAVLFTIVAIMVLRVHRPVTMLRQATRMIAAGDFTCDIQITSEDEIGQCARGFTIMRDQIRRRTQELVRSRWEYKNLFEQVPCFICVINKDLQIVRQNTCMQDRFKGSIGMHCYEVFKKRTEQCEDCHALDTLTRGASCRKEHCGLTESGEQSNYVSYTTPILDDKGNVIYAMIIAVDIEDRVKLEKELMATKDFQTNLIDNSIHGIVATDEHGKIAIFNRAAEALFGYTSEDVIGDPSLEKYFPQQFVQRIVDSYLGKEAEIPRVIAQETTILSAEGEQIPVRFSGFILTENGRTSGSVGFYQDLRTYKKLEREKQASDRLAVVGQTVAGLAHGIKNIIQGLEGGVFVVQSAVEDDDKELLARGWTMVQKNIALVSSLVQDLLSYAKERPPQYEETDVNLLAEEVCALYDIRAQEKSIVIERQFDSQVGALFKTYLDQRGIHTCLSNLVANAIDACELDKKDVQHKIVVKTGIDGEGNLVFEVSDNGIGMTDEVKSKIFSSFFSTKGSRGTGLGLLITSKIVMEHGGEMAFESEPGEGTRFVLKIPQSWASDPAGTPRPDSESYVDAEVVDSDSADSKVSASELM